MNVETIQDIFFALIYKSKVILTPLFATFLVFITPITGMLITTSLFVAADTLFAIYVAVKQGGIQAYKSNSLFNIVPKSFFYMSTILLAFMINQFLILDPINLFTRIVCGAWIYIEIKSMDETSMKYGNRSIWVILKEMISKLKGFKKDLNELNDDKKDEKDKKEDDKSE
ncbi:hypothetical protein LZZ90_08315 [Flavobacterium sp. SM15]|uniref:phage holin family protein n=1 Tax=Flavobacterium sp. SM15 TaxID=2908005 RepID=UPI001EDAF0F0|nr:hypothetical protein [Flavobacterium sp. SM15]MCG2611510.1 hypothetical protein [Flavobacterium sp. SM15]